MSLLSKYFPEVAQRELAEIRHVRQDPPNHDKLVSPGHGSPWNTAEELNTKWRTILTLEMQGLTKIEIAKVLDTSAGTISNITRDERYITYRNEYLAKIDDDFLAMKPLAFRALHNGLTCGTVDVALKASDQWFRAASYGGYAKNPEPAKNVSAEDVVKQLLHIEADNVQVNINTEK